jgi:hypothetical protein
MGWPLNLSVIWRQAPRFFRGLTGHTCGEGSGPLEKSAALYQKPWGATTETTNYLKETQALLPDTASSSRRNGKYTTRRATAIVLRQSIV